MCCQCVNERSDVVEDVEEALESGKVSARLDACGELCFGVSPITLRPSGRNEGRGSRTGAGIAMLGIKLNVVQCIEYADEGLSGDLVAHFEG